MEHHANIIPWQLLRRHADVKIRVVEMDEYSTSSSISRSSTREPLWLHSAISRTCWVR
jgi:selenocysteine lyase/cysteine desulfurase